MTGSAYVVAESDAGRKLVDVVKDRLGVVAITEVGELVRGGAITVDGVPGGINDLVAVGASLVVAEAAIAALRADGRVTEPSDVPVPVVHEDDHLVVVDKPSGMHVHPLGPYREDTLVGALLWRAGARPDRPWSAWRPRPTHRLDRATSGLLLVAKDPATQRAVDLLRAEGLVRRTYRATVVGELADDRGTIDVPLGRDPRDDRRRAAVPVADGGQPAVSRWQVVARSAGTTMVELTLETGRTHQLRAHLAHLGHPIVGDELYAGDVATATSADIPLRAVRLTLPHPIEPGTLDLRVESDAGGVPAPALREVAQVWWDVEDDPVVRWSSDGRRYVLVDVSLDHELVLAELDIAPRDPEAVARVLADGLAACDFPPTGDGAARSRVEATLRAAGRSDLRLAGDD